jgi:hypothetical protein
MLYQDKKQIEESINRAPYLPSSLDHSSFPLLKPYNHSLIYTIAGTLSMTPNNVQEKAS